ncbi:MAG: hypothetical protein KF802_16435 [Bdellovibrionaceae bacterium]|nr:hypothetical protein [Pseudobdellovibrionaceae bacterium]
MATLERGQLTHSLRFLAEKWGWEKDAVARFLRQLKTETMIETQTATGQSVITICNYNQYQKVSLPKRDSNATDTATATRQQRDKEESIESIEVDMFMEGENYWPSDYKERFWQAYPHKVGKGVALKALEKVKKQSKVAFNDLLAAIERYVRDKPEKQPYAHPSTWINGERWLDEPAPNAGAKNGQPTHYRNGKTDGRDFFARMAGFQGNGSGQNGEPHRGPEIDLTGETVGRGRT